MRPQNQGMKKNRVLPLHSKGFGLDPLTIWKAKRPHDDVVDFSIQGPEIPPFNIPSNKRR